MRGAFDVDQPTGERWNLALEVLERGESAVSVGGLNLYRAAGAPGADRRLQVEIRATATPEGLTQARAEKDVAAGLSQLDELRSDERFAALVAEHGVAVEYVTDYDTGRTALAAVAANGSVVWREGFEPGT
jgi:hypothetical protein